ncbi:hypothetical protein L484_004199 [Morus notabilis]|uniref:Uncharacterized protein n=1 Tax=Morus notabilis TaxID=981085 RepID=W9RDM9_9ROSA|nr:UPF0481 protein At3g47200 [Morus notabilis]EXB71064.1 hypothetical protein L484_004199 [Morus notabilis]
MEESSRSEGSQSKEGHIIEVKEEMEGEEGDQGSHQLVSKMKQKMEDVSKLVFIFRIPRSENDKEYTPSKVSIGPIHHKATKTLEIEDHKWKYTASLLNRKPNLEATIDACVKALKESEHRIRKCYGEQFNNIKSNDFVEIILVDCCFIIELFLKFSIKGLRRRNDTIFTTPGSLYELRSDMILLENQIPLFVLLQIFHIVPIPPQCTMSFNQLASRFFRNMVPGDLQYLHEKFNQEGYHFLDLIRRCIIPARVLPNKTSCTTSDPKGLESATRLQKAGIRFKRGWTYSLLDVTFHHRGVLTIPQLEIKECTEELLRNLIALETHLADTQQTTSYAFLMHCLVKSKKDVELLGERRVLSYEEGKEDDVVAMFQKLGEKVTAKDSYYLRLLEQVHEYHTKNLHSKWGKLMSGCAKKTTLSFVVFVVAILLLVLTFVGVFFSVLSFFLHRS